MIKPDDILIGMEIFYTIGGIASAMVIALWRLFSKYSRLENKIEFLENASKHDDQKYLELVRKIDAISAEITKMRLEMLSAHNEISERVIRVEAKGNGVNDLNHSRR